MDLEEQLKRAGLVAGIGAAAAVPVLMAIHRRGGRRFAKSVLHGCLDLTDTLKDSAGETLEQWGDMLAEVKAERAAAAAAGSAAGAGGASAAGATAGGAASADAGADESAAPGAEGESTGPERAQATSSHDPASDNGQDETLHRRGVDHA